jgi:alpha-amylase
LGRGERLFPDDRRFNNGDKSNDLNFRTKTTGKLRGFEGGDIFSKKIDEGYFDKWN